MRFWRGGVKHSGTRLGCDRQEVLGARWGVSGSALVGLFFGLFREAAGRVFGGVEGGVWRRERERFGGSKCDFFGKWRGGVRYGIYSS